MSMRTLPDEVVSHLLDNCPGRTDQALQPRFGISYNTWRKIAAGQPIRATVAERLIDRVRFEQSRLA